MSSDDQTVGQQPPQERPTASTTGDEIETERADTGGLSSINTTAGARRVGESSIGMLVVEAELAAEGHELDNPAVPVKAVADNALERLEKEGLEPAWMRPWEDGE